MESSKGEKGSPDENRKHERNTKMNYTIEYTTDAWNALFKRWTATSAGEGAFSNSLDAARKMLCDWIRANVSDDGDYDVEGLCATAMTLDVGDEMRAGEMDGFARNYTLRISAL